MASFAASPLVRDSTVPTAYAPSAPVDRWLVWGLPLVLLMLSVLVLGSHYESNDDVLMTYVLSDLPTIERLPALGRTYNLWVGIGAGLSALYRAAPGVPWYGLTLYAGLYLAVALSFRLLLNTPLGQASGGAKAGWLSAFFGLFFTEHVLFFNFTRVSILLAGAALLRVLYDRSYFGRHPARLLGPGAALVLALLIRYQSVAMALLLCAGPAIALEYRFGRMGRRSLSSVAGVGFALILVAGFGYVASQVYAGVTLAPPRLYGVFNQILDYRTYFFHGGLSAEDGLRTDAVGHWIMGDAGVFTEAFFARAGGVDWGRYLRTTLPFRVSEFININLNFLGQWALLLALGWGLVRTAASRSAWWLTVATLLYVGAFIGALVFLKLPHRIVSSILTLLALTLVPLARELPIWPGNGGGVGNARTPRALVAMLVLAALFHAGRSGARSLKYRRLQAENEAVLARFGARYRANLVLLGAPGTYYFYLHPLKAYTLHDVRRIGIDGWITSLTWYGEHCRTLTGAATWAGAQRAAARRPEARWLLTPAYARFLTAYHRGLHQHELTLTPLAATPPEPGTKELEYRAAFEPLSAAGAPTP